MYLEVLSSLAKGISAWVVLKWHLNKFIQDSVFPVQIQKMNRLFSLPALPWKARWAGASMLMWKGRTSAGVQASSVKTDWKSSCHILRSDYTWEREHKGQCKSSSAAARNSQMVLWDTATVLLSSAALLVHKKQKHQNLTLLSCAVSLDQIQSLQPGGKAALA